MTFKKYFLIVAVLFVLVVFTFYLQYERQGEATPPVLGISADRFTVNGATKFLLGLSYFDALGWKVSDLDGLQSRGFNLIRIWLDWGIWTDRSRSFFNEDGSMKNAQTILDLVRAAAARGIVVDVTILNSCSVQGGECASSGFQNMEIAKTAIKNAVNLLRSEPNVFFDIVNERDTDVGIWTNSVMTDLVNAAKQQDANAIITFSHTGDLDDGSGAMDAELNTGIHLVAPHYRRTTGWYDQTDQRVNATKGYLASVGRKIPVYLQEEQRRGFHTVPTYVVEDHPKEEFFQAAREAMNSGAAGWVFHTAAGFELSDTRSIFENLDNVEREVVDGLSGELDASIKQLAGRIPG